MKKKQSPIYRSTASIRSVLFAAAIMWACATPVTAQTGVPTAEAPPLAVGTPMPAFHTTTLSGRPFHSRSLRGHVVVLDFWATWCVSCKFDMPGIEKIHEDYGPRGVNVIGVSLDTDNAKQVGPTVRKIGVTYPVFVSPKQNLAVGRAFAADVLPSVYIVDQRGIVRWSYSGDYPTEDADIRAIVDKLLKQGSTANGRRAGGHK